MDFYNFIKLLPWRLHPFGFSHWYKLDSCVCVCVWLNKNLIFPISVDQIKRKKLPAVVCSNGNTSYSRVCPPFILGGPIWPTWPKMAHQNQHFLNNTKFFSLFFLNASYISFNKNFDNFLFWKMSNIQK